MNIDRKEARYQSISRKISRLEVGLGRLQQSDGRFFWIRLGVLLGGALLSFLALTLAPAGIGRFVVAAWAIAFAGVVYFHRRVDHSLLRFKLAMHLARSQLARMRLDWEQIPRPETAGTPGAGGDGSLPQRDHPFAPDLDITGPRSIHQLADTAISVGGSRRLRAWLLDPLTEPEAVGERQDILREMLPLTGFRSRLSLAGALVSSRTAERWDGEELLAWLEKRPAAKSLWPYLLLLTALAAVNIGLFLLSLLARLPAWWIFSLIGYGFIYMVKYRELSETFSQAQHLSVGLDRFRAVLTHLEGYRYPKGSRLATLCEPFWAAVQRPSRALRRIAGIAAAASLQNNPFVWFLLNATVPWDLYFATRLQQYKQEMQALLPVWLDRWYELEALNSLANFAYLHPNYVFPEVRPYGGLGEGAVFAAASLGHPLIPEGVKVTNDFQIENLGEIVLITGSNMSGKSTFLRTLGVNLCLAYAGGPVNAASLHTIPMRLFTCLNVSDSLSDGISYFYAEVRRLKALLVELDRDHPFPLFFLIDEIFRGTNNRERQIGSRAYVEALVGKHGLGLISTHDLELVRLADELSWISNYHFREEVKEGRMVFDYRLRRGPSPTTNALKIMALEGLPVEFEEN